MPLLGGFTRQEPAGLAVPKGGVDAALFQKLIVAAVFDDAAFVHDHETIHSGDR